MSGGKDVVDLTVKDGDARAIIEAAQKGKPGSLEPFRKLLDKDAELTGLFVARLGAAINAEHALAEYSGSGNVLVKETLSRELASLRRELASSADGPLEHLLIDRTALAWLAVTTAEQRRANVWRAGSVPYESADFWDRRVSRLNADFLKACRTLATVRRLLVPSIGQLNFAQQQVNVASKLT